MQIRFVPARIQSAASSLACVATFRPAGASPYLTRCQARRALHVDQFSESQRGLAIPHCRFSQFQIEALLAHAMLSIPATKGFEIGSGFAGTTMRGSMHNDAFVARADGRLGTATNFRHANSCSVRLMFLQATYFYSPVLFHMCVSAAACKVAFRMVPILSSASHSSRRPRLAKRKQHPHLTVCICTLDCAVSQPMSRIHHVQHACIFIPIRRPGRDAVLEAKGRHDPCIVPRAVPIVEAMCALVLADCALAQAARTSAASIYETISNLRVAPKVDTNATITASAPGEGSNASAALPVSETSSSAALLSSDDATGS